MRNTQNAHTVVPQAEQYRMPEVPEAVGPQVQHEPERQGATASAPTELVVSASQERPGVYLSETESRYSQIVARDDQIITDSRNRSIAAEHGAITPKQQAQYSGLPLELVKIADRFLDANDLVLCRHDPEFWESFGYLIGSAESISIEAVIEAISMCVLNADNPTRNPIRRAHFYAELQAAQKMKAIRNRELRNKTDRVAIRRKLASTVSEADRKRASLGLPPEAVCESQPFIEETQPLRDEREAIYLRAEKRASETQGEYFEPGDHLVTTEEGQRLREISKELGEVPQD